MNLSIYHWAVIGAGPAGIAAVGRLIDTGIPPSDILWLDPHFKVGDLGAYWQEVSSNTTVGRFLDFLKASPAFNYDLEASTYRLNQLPLEETCLLTEIVQPLQGVTEQLRQQVSSVCVSVNNLFLTQGHWHLETENTLFHAYNVILATGADAISLPHPDVSVIPFHQAISFKKLSKLVNKKDTYAVFGSSHSAIIILQALIDLGVHQVVNFYRSPLRYAITQGDWTLFDNTGLKGNAAAWARRYIDGEWPANLVRHLSREDNLERYLPSCQHVIYAVGFNRRHSFHIDGLLGLHPNTHHGILAPGLFGLGIGFPETTEDPFGHVESQVGLWKFMVYLNKVLPLWHSYSLN